MHIYFPAQVPQQAIGTTDLIDSVRVKTLALELLEGLEESLTVEPGTHLFIGHRWARVVNFGTEPCVDSPVLPHARLI